MKIWTTGDTMEQLNKRKKKTVSVKLEYSRVLD